MKIQLWYKSSEVLSFPLRRMCLSPVAQCWCCGPVPPARWWCGGGGTLEDGAEFLLTHVRPVSLARLVPAHPPHWRRPDDHSCRSSRPPPLPRRRHPPRAPAGSPAPSAPCLPGLSLHLHCSRRSHVCRKHTPRSRSPLWIASSFHWGVVLCPQRNPPTGWDPSAEGPCRIRPHFFSPGWWVPLYWAHQTAVSCLNLVLFARVCCQALA